MLKLSPKSIERLENKVKEVFQKEKQKETEGKNDEIQKTNTDPTPVLGNSRKKTENRGKKLSKK